VAAYGESGRPVLSSTCGIVRASPYTELDDAYTTRRAPASRAATSTLRNPSTFTWLLLKGSASDRGTEASAA
jgi:hypothetical protein